MELSSDSYVFDNTTNQFRVLVNPSMYLEGKYECCLHEINFPRLKTKDLWVDHSARLGSSKRYTIEDGSFTNATELLQKMVVTGVTFRYVHQYEKVVVSIPTRQIISFSPNLASILGFIPYKSYSGTVYSEDKLNFETFIVPILFQTSLVAPQVFGEDRRPVLRSIYQNGGHLEFSPKYLPVIVSKLEELSFQFTDKNNEAIEFVPGEVYFTLHLKKCRTD